MTHGRTPKICLDDESSERSDDRGLHTIVRTYTLLNFSAREQAEQALATDPACPLIDPVYYLRRTAVTVQQSPTLDDYFVGEATWTLKDDKGYGAEQFSGSVGTASENVRTGIYEDASSQAAYTVPGKTPPRNNGLIGVTEDGEVEGVDVPVATLEFQINIPYEKGTLNYMQTLTTLYRYVEKPNRVPWRGFGVREVKLTSVSLSTQGETEDMLTFTFAASPTETNIKILTDSNDPNNPDTWIIVAEKKGWDYLWLSYESIEDTAADNVKVAKPVAAYVNQVQPSVDLNEILP